MIYYIRNDVDNLIGFKYNDNFYYYVKNLQNDIIGILDSNFNLIVNYQYDSWGNILSITDNVGNVIVDTSHIGIINPYRYRSYYYDKETNLYYLNSRYYSSVLKQFLNDDCIIGANSNILCYSLYVYCGNNPVVNVDPSGRGFLKDTWNGTCNFVGNVGKTVKKAAKYTISSIKSIESKIKGVWNTLKDSFVLEYGSGYGLSASLGSAEAEFYEDKTTRYAGGKKTTGTSISSCIVLPKGKKSKIGYQYQVFHKSHYVSGDIEESIKHSQPYASFFDIHSCEHTEYSVTRFTSTNTNVGVASDNFVGLDFYLHVVVGFHIKIGFNC